MDYSILLGIHFVDRAAEDATTAAAIEGVAASGAGANATDRGAGASSTPQTPQRLLKNGAESESESEGEGDDRRPLLDGGRRAEDLETGPSSTVVESTLGTPAPPPHNLFSIPRQRVRWRVCVCGRARACAVGRVFSRSCVCGGACACSPYPYIDGVLSLERENYIPLHIRPSSASPEIEKRRNKNKKNKNKKMKKGGRSKSGRRRRERGGTTNNASHASPPLPSSDHSINLAASSPDEDWAEAKADKPAGSLRVRRTSDDDGDNDDGDFEVKRAEGEEMRKKKKKEKIEDAYADDSDYSTDSYDSEDEFSDDVEGRLFRYTVSACCVLRGDNADTTPHTAHRTPHTAHRTPHTAHRTPHTAHRTPHTTNEWSGMRGSCRWMGRRSTTCASSTSCSSTTSTRRPNASGKCASCTRTSYVAPALSPPRPIGGTLSLVVHLALILIRGVCACRVVSCVCGVQHGVSVQPPPRYRDRFVACAFDLVTSPDATAS
jgi:hypothetical protein